MQYPYHKKIVVSGMPWYYRRQNGVYVEMHKLVKDSAVPQIERLVPVYQKAIQYGSVYTITKESDEEPWQFKKNGNVIYENHLLLGNWPQFVVSQDESVWTTLRNYRAPAHLVFYALIFLLSLLIPGLFPLFCILFVVSLLWSHEP